MTRLTIVTPTLNQGAFIERTIRSVISQLGEDDTYVVVDGGSTDQTHTVLERWADRISHIYVRDGGQAEALRYGFEMHPAAYACYLNSDDLFLPNAIGKALDYLGDASADVVGCYSNRVFIDPDDHVTGVWRLPGHVSYLMRRWDYIPQETCFWRYDAMRQCGGIDSSLDFAMDFDLFVRLMERGALRRVEDYWAAFRVHSQSKTATLNNRVGKAEVSEIQSRYGIRHRFPDRALGALLREYIKWRGRVSAEHLECLQKEIYSIG